MFNKQIKYHNVVIARNGSFVGLYRIDGGKMKLWRPINKESYGRQIIIDKREPIEEWGSGGHQGISGQWFCNEMHKIPKKYNVHDMGHLKLLDSLLGGAHRDVAERIEKGK